MKQEKLTRFIKPEDANQKWYVVDAKDQTLGRLASQVARVIRGKNKATFTPNNILSSSGHRRLCRGYQRRQSENCRKTRRNENLLSSYRLPGRFERKSI